MYNGFPTYFHRSMFSFSHSGGGFLHPMILFIMCQTKCSFSPPTTREDKPHQQDASSPHPHLRQLLLVPRPKGFLLLFPSLSLDIWPHPHVFILHRLAPHALFRRCRLRIGQLAFPSHRTGGGLSPERGWRCLIYIWIHLYWLLILTTCIYRILIYIHIMHALRLAV